MKKALMLSMIVAAPAMAGLEIKDEKGKHLDVVSDGKVLVRYMYEHDTSTKETHHATYKPYLHVFDAEGKKPITKGAGGKYPHHRGIFIGWNRIGCEGKKYDRWHMKGGDIVHQKFSKTEVKDGVAHVTSITHWLDENGKPILEEERSFAVSEGKHGGRIFIDFQSKLTPVKGDISLKGDPEHAGVHYRPADAVDKKKTKYVYPKGVTDVKKVKDMAWAAENYTLDGKEYGVLHMNHRDNPKGTKHSAYRDYGRFGAFFEKDVKKGESLTVRYGFVIFDGKLPGQDQLQKIREEWK